MENKYYSEDFVVDSDYRIDYANSIIGFLQQKKERAEKRRKEFINPETYKKNSNEYRKKFVEMLGFPLVEGFGIPKLVKKEFVVKDKNVNIFRLQFLFDCGIKFYGILFEQENKANVPFVFCLHGGKGTPELIGSINLDSANYNHLVRRITDRGASVFAPQLLLWDKSNYGVEYDRILTDGKFRQFGGSITAFELALMSGCVEYFVQIEKINKDTLGVAGMSYGGMYALLLTAINEQIQVCYSSSWVNDGFVTSWADWSYLNAQNTFAVAEIAGLVAPRPLVVGMGDNDQLFDYKLTITECEKIKQFYEVFGRQDNFKCVIFNGVHEVDKQDDEICFFYDKLTRK